MNRKFKGEPRSRRPIQLAVGVIVAAVVIAALVITEPWTYFVVDEVDEAFPSLTDSQRDALRGMPPEQKDALMAMAEEDAAMAADVAIAQTGDDVVVPPAQQAMPDDMPAEPVVLHSGAFITIDAIHKAEGAAIIYELPDGRRVLRFEDFRSANGPDLHVYLSSAAPKSAFAGLGEDALHLGSLKGNVGNQNYDIPDDADLSRYQSAVIYCAPFRVVFSSAELS